jgi:dihydrodipicolinate synthase/N-acetylneuraminate lyase
MKDWRTELNHGVVIPACPLALDDAGQWSEMHQQALLRYYSAAGAGGVAVGVHTTQFAIREPQYSLYKPVLTFTKDVLDSTECRPGFVRIAGICGETQQALSEASLAADLQYHAGLLSLSALKTATDDQLIEHCRQVSNILPVFGFYLQPAVGGRELSYHFWRRFCELPNVVAIKIAAFNRYQTWDVVRAAIESGRTDIALYTGNDDNIIVDLLTTFEYAGTSRRIVGGLLGQWAVWTHAAVRMLQQIHSESHSDDRIDATWLTRNMHLTDANAVIFDAAHGFAGCIPGINEVLRRQGLLPSSRCLDPHEVLSLGQAQELDRITAAYPQLHDNDFVSEHLQQWL